MGKRIIAVVIAAALCLAIAMLWTPGVRGKERNPFWPVEDITTSSKRPSGVPSSDLLAESIYLPCIFREFFACNTVLVSVASDGTQTNSWSSELSGLSIDGSFAVFGSSADNLVIGDSNGFRDIFVHNLKTRQTERVSVATNGTQSNEDVMWPAISGDGRYVTFHSRASNLVSGDSNDWYDAFVHDRQTGETRRVSVSSNGAQADKGSGNTSISTDGRYVSFSSIATNLVGGDTNETMDIFVHDLSTNKTSLVSKASNGALGNGPSNMTAISATGRYVAFASFASNLVGGDTNGFYDVFVHDRQTGTTTRVSVASDGTQGNEISYEPSISGDGRYVSFWSEASNLVAGDTNGVMDIFVHDRQTSLTRRVSVASDGSQANGTSENHSLSGDGRYIVFDSEADNLVSNDSNGYQDVFIHDLHTGKTRLVSVNAGRIQGELASLSPTISADGSQVIFSSSSTNLVSEDTNGQFDVFVTSCR